MNTDALDIGLLAAVPLSILELAGLDEVRRERVRMWWAHDAADQIGSHGDALQFGGKSGLAAKVFHHLARGLAAAAFQPGGIAFHGTHWCWPRHPGGTPAVLGLCPAIDELIADEPPATPAPVRRPVATLDTGGLL